MNSYVINELTSILVDAVGASNFVLAREEITVEINKNSKLGDYATPVAMVLAKKYQQEPLQMAEILVKHIHQKYPLIKKIDFVAPGFINIDINTAVFSFLLMKIINEKNNYGRGENKNCRYNLEFISANPTGLLHLGHARNGALGDTLANILAFQGYDVTREYYINDAGNQVTILGQSIFIRYQNLCGNNMSLKTDSYRGNEIITAAEKFYQIHGKKFANCQFDEPTALIFQQYGIKFMLAEIKKDLKHFNVKINKWFSEASLYQDDTITNLIATLKTDNYVYEEEGALFLRTTLFNDDKDRVIVKNDKSFTYLLPDLAYHHLKFQRSDLLLNIWGADHYGYIPRMKAGMTMLGNDASKLNIIAMQMVKVVENGKEQKMSKRAGTAITLREMLKLVGKDALRYFMIARAADSHLDIDLALAKKQSNENPVFYIQYAHARINQIIAKQGKFTIVNEIDLLINDKEKELLIMLDDYINVLQRIEKQHQPHLLTNYLHKLAKLFHGYYNENKVITENNLLTDQRLTLVLAIKQIIANGLQLIGVSAPNVM